MLDEAPIWDRDGDWLAARAAVAKRLEARCSINPQRLHRIQKSFRPITALNSLYETSAKQLIRASAKPIPFTAWSWDGAI